MRLLDTPFAIRIASVTLICVFVGLIAGCLVAASQIKFRTEETQAAVALSEHYGTVERLLWKEANTVRVHGIEQQDSSWTANIRDERLAGVEIEHVLGTIDATGDTRDRAIVAQTEHDHADYTELLRQLFAQVDSRDNEAQSTFRRSTAIFDRMQARIDRRASDQHEAAVSALQRLASTQRVVVQMIAVSSIVATALIVLSSLMVVRYRTTIAISRRRELDRLKVASLTDILTGLANSRAFNDELEQALAVARRDVTSVSLALIDVDCFKSVNDSRGHLEGDRVLSYLGKLLGNLRAADRGFRLGGDEFAVLLPKTDAAEAIVVMDRLRREAAEVLGGSTISVGISSTIGCDTDAATLRSNADIALYAAKRRGRNNVSSHQNSDPCLHEAASEATAAVHN